MNQAVKVGITQTTVSFSNDEGEAKIIKFVKQAKESNVDILGLPEDCICGLLKQAKNYNPLGFISKIAKENNISIFGSNVTIENAKYYETGFFFNKQGLLLSKVHKIILTPEEKRIGINQGDKLEVFSTEFGNAAILICKDAFNRYTSLWVNKLKRLRVDYLFVPSMSIKVDHNSINYWLDSLWLLGRNFDIYILAPGTIGKNYTLYPSFGNSLIVDKDNGFAKKGSENEEKLLIANLRVRSLSEIERNYKEKWQPTTTPKVKILKK